MSHEAGPFERAVRRQAALLKILRYHVYRRRQRPNPGWWLR